VIELYAVVDHPGPPLPALAPLSAVAERDLALVCAPAGDAALSPESLWRHEHVVEALMEGRDLLPVRYGTRVEDEQAAARALKERHAELACALDGVRGAVELSVRVLGEREPSAAPEAAQSGSDYIRAKARAAAASDGAARAVHEPLARVARASGKRPAQAESELLRAAYLVDRERVADFARRVSKLQDAHPRLRLLCTGPWPPYSFSAT
jgi:hypothetical protein